ncbi:MAG: MBL fold metallo-hydrolase [Acidobacteriota bacterium]
MPSHLTLLGTGTCQLQTRRKASSVLLELDGLRIVFDMGRGIADRLAELGLRQDDVEHVVLSHFHPDHVSDLVPYLQAAAWSRIDPRTRDLHIWGPRGLEVQLMRLLSLFDVDNLSRPSWRVHLHEVRDGALEIADRRFGWPALPPAGNHGLQLVTPAGRFVITGDAHFGPSLIASLREARLAIVDSGHLVDAELIEVAVASGVERMICSHVYRTLDLERLEQAAQARGFAGRIELAADGLRFDLDAPERPAVDLLADGATDRQETRA